jgi:hypothetical protein
VYYRTTLRTKITVEPRPESTGSTTRLLGDTVDRTCCERERPLRHVGQIRQGIGRIAP